MNTILSAARRYNTLLVVLLALAMSAIMIAACDSGVTTDDIAASELSAREDVAIAKRDKVLVCHVGNTPPEYDPECKGSGKCGDLGKTDLIHVADVTKHIDNHDSDYLPGDVGASGVGKEDTSDDGVFVDDGCVPETVFAIAYTNVDEVDGFNPDFDKLIAKLVDTDGSGDISVDDEVITDQYPTTLAGDPFGTFGVTVHRVVLTDLKHTPTVVDVLTPDAGRFLWVHVGDDYEFYREDVDDGEDTCLWSDNFGATEKDLISVNVECPSLPSVAAHAFAEGVADDPFIDVDIFGP